MLIYSVRFIDLLCGGTLVKRSSGIIPLLYQFFFRITMYSTVLQVILSYYKLFYHIKSYSTTVPVILLYYKLFYRITGYAADF